MANIKVSELPLAGPITGNEELLGVQSGASVKIQTNALKALGSEVYATEALGRAAVIDGACFKVVGSGNIATREYRRTNASTSVLVAEYPSIGLFTSIPAPNKVPIAGAEGTIKQAWVHELEFALDKLRAATNKALYGDGPYPDLDFQFQGANMLDPRIEFTRASKDWDWEGREYGINEPVLTDEGLWVSGARTNLFLQSLDLTQLPWLALGSIRKLPGIKSPIGTDVFSLDRDVEGGNYFYQPVIIEEGIDYTLSCLVQFKTGDEEYRIFMSSAVFDGGGASVFTLGVDGGLDATTGGQYKNLGGGWFLIWRSGKGKENVTGNYIQIHAYPNDPLVDNFISAPQFEVGAVPTSFIPTEGSQVTVAVTNSELDIDGFFGDEGTVVFDTYMLGPRVSPGFALAMVGEGGSQEYMGLGYGSANPRRVFVVSGGESSNINVGGPEFNEPTVFAFTWSGRDFAFFVNGTKVHFGTHGASMPVYKNLYIGSRGDAGRCPINSRNLQLYKKRLTDEQLQELTTL